MYEKITSITGNSPENFITVEASLPLDSEVRVTTVGNSYVFNTASVATEYEITFTVELNWTSGYTAGNNGTIGLNLN